VLLECKSCRQPFLDTSQSLALVGGDSRQSQLFATRHGLWRNTVLLQSSNYIFARVVVHALYLDVAASVVAGCFMRFIVGSGGHRFEMWQSNT